MVEEPEEVEAEIVGDDGDDSLQGPVRSLPQRAPASELDPWRSEVRTVAIAAAGGVAAGAATVAAVNAVRERSLRKAGRRGLLRRKQPRDEGILASRSFRVDVHLLDR